jgi:hypothetical protein
MMTMTFMQTHAPSDSFPGGRTNSHPTAPSPLSLDSHPNFVPFSPELGMLIPGEREHGNPTLIRQESGR